MTVVTCGWLTARLELSAVSSQRLLSSAASWMDLSANNWCCRLERHVIARRNGKEVSCNVISGRRPLKRRLHIAIGMQTRLQTGLQTGASSVYTERLVCKPVCQPIVVTFTQGDWFAYRYAYRFANQASKHCLRTWPRPLASLRNVYDAVSAACRWKRSTRSNIYKINNK